MTERFSEKVRFAVESGRKQIFIRDAGGHLDRKGIENAGLELVGKYKSEIDGLEKGLKRKGQTEAERANRMAHLQNLLRARVRLEAKLPKQPTRK